MKLILFQADPHMIAVLPIEHNVLCCYYLQNTEITVRRGQLVTPFHKLIDV